MLSRFWSLRIFTVKMTSVRPAVSISSRQASASSIIPLFAASQEPLSRLPACIVVKPAATPSIHTFIVMLVSSYRTSFPVYSLGSTSSIKAAIDSVDTWSLSEAPFSDDPFPASSSNGSPVSRSLLSGAEDTLDPLSLCDDGTELLGSGAEPEQPAAENTKRTDNNNASTFLHIPRSSSNTFCCGKIPLPNDMITHFLTLVKNTLFMGVATVL